MTARENELADRLEARAKRADREADACFDGPRPDRANGTASRDEARLLRLAASTLRANAERIKALEEALAAPRFVLTRIFDLLSEPCGPDEAACALALAKVGIEDIDDHAAPKPEGEETK